ncbi:nucleotidyltransferase domain-containing protein [Halegenticoccus soli]|uniref:nucleotidyltransferase domain-containing protein n=1 Tax=Halegenticoccus soli TaxID=1985678 RepID=UPI000C6E44D5|nr:nucleotidyltransferase domain-containing protein [Halegenticoccus soli]
MDELGGWSREGLARIVADAVGTEGSPGFYAVTGSRIYGFAGVDSDVDVRGFHVADGVRYLLLEPPAERIAATVSPGEGGPAEADPDGEGRRIEADPVGEEDRAEIDLVSYELRTFGTLLAESNVNALEAVLDGIVVTDAPEVRVEWLRDAIREELPLDAPARYAGMARHNYERCRRDDATAKTYLYALRGALAAHYVAERSDVVADVRTLADAVLGDADLADELVDAKRAGGELDPALASSAERAIEALLDAADFEGPDAAERRAYRERLDEWMLEARGIDRKRSLGGR